MEIWKMIYRNLLHHKLRTSLTALASTIALFGFCMIHTLIDAWYSGVNESSKERLIVRNAVSLVFPLPSAYEPQIARIPGVVAVGYGNWFGGEYRDNRYQFGQFAISDNYLNLVPELNVPAEQMAAWLKDRQGILIGGDIARKFELKVGDVMQIKGTLYPGLWEFKVSGIFSGRPGTGDERQVFFRWNYLNERNRMEIKRSPDHVGFYSIQLLTGFSPAQVAEAVDSNFRNSYAETKTETESEFVRGFVSMSSAIISALNIVSGVVVAIMLLVVTNTVLLSFRERNREYAILRALGFGNKHFVQVIGGEALLYCALGLSTVGVTLGVVFSIPREKLLGPLMDIIPVFSPSPTTLGMTIGSAIAVAILSSIPPIVIVSRENVAQAMRNYF